MFKHDYGVLKYSIYITVYIILSASVYFIAKKKYDASIRTKTGSDSASRINGKIYSSYQKLFLILIFCAYAIILPASVIHGLHGDEINHIWLIDSITNDFDLNLSNNVPKDKYYLVAHYFFKSENELFTSVMPGMAALAAPFYLIAGVTGFRFMIVLITCSLAFIAYKLSVEYSGSEKNSFLFSLIFFLLNPFVVYSSQIYPETAAALCAMLSIFFLKKHKPFAAGLSISFLLWFHIKYYVIVVLLVFIVLLLLIKSTFKLKQFLLFAIPVMFSLIFFEVYCYSVFNSFNPFAAYVQGSDAGYKNFSELFSNVILNNNFFEQLKINFFDLQFGLFVNSPFYIFGFISVFYCLINNFKKYWQLAILFFGYCFYICINNQGYNGYSPLNRLLIPCLPVLIISSSGMFADLQSRFFNKPFFKSLVLFLKILFFVSFIISSVYVTVPVSRYPDYSQKNSIYALFEKILYRGFRIQLNPVK